MSPPIRTIRILTDGKMGDLAQCRGVAAHFDATVVERVVQAEGLRSLPLPFVGLSPGERPDNPDSPVAPPWPDVVIASGRRTLPYLARLKQEAPDTFLAYLKKPTWAGRHAAHFIWAPNHDEVGPHSGSLFQTDTAPHAITDDSLAEARSTAPFSVAEKPVTGIVLGGDAGSVRWTAENAQRFAELAALAAAKGTVLVTRSRRTPDVLWQALHSAFPNAWFDEDGTAYHPLLACSDRLIVTGDSHNMVSEALATGVPVHVHRPDGLKAKLAGFLDRMEAKGAIRTLAAPLVAYEAQRIDATADIAAAIKEARG